MIKIIPLLIVVHIAAASYGVTWDCGRCTSSSIGTNCFSFQGGPFTTYYQESIDNKYSSCDESNLTFPTIFTFNCSSACIDCGISIKTKGISFSVCQQDSNGQIMTQLLDLYYKSYKNNTKLSYNWCGDLNCPSDSWSIGLIIGVVAGIILVVGAGIVGFIYCKRKNRNAKEMSFSGPIESGEGDRYQHDQSFRGQGRIGSQEQGRRSSQRRDSLIKSVNLSAEQGPLLR